jgi:preprotein translocase subunit SecA
MARDKIGERRTRLEKNKKRTEWSRKSMTSDEIDAEKELLDSTPPVEPIKADDEPGRNDPCPCGSGKKYKKCCALK